MDFSKLTLQEKEELFNRAKTSYYNSSDEILTDSEYDELEKDLNLENTSYIGSAKGNYDFKHSFIMGSLSKTQVKEQKDGNVNWNTVSSDINSYLSKSNSNYFETTPKLDGCSFSCEFKKVNNKAELISVATRGNGEWGSDIKHWFLPLLNTEYWNRINECVSSLCICNSNDILCIRGEVLVKLSDFSAKYQDQYINPRAFTAGMLGIKYEDATQDKLEQGKDLHFVCYDYRLVSNGHYQELSWMNENDPTYKLLKPYLGHIGELPNMQYCQVYDSSLLSMQTIQKIYDDYDNFRQNVSEYALDGIVFKPACSDREYNEKRNRPVDCIAMKFMPMLNATEIVDIEWAVRKTGEYFPTAILKPIKMQDGKTISRAALHNYNYIIKNEVGIGSKVRISLAGDIIPFIYEVVESAPIDNINLPEDSYVKQDSTSLVLHLMKAFTEEEQLKNKFLMSALTLNINTVGPAAAEDIFNALNNDIKDLDNILYAMNQDAYNKIYDVLGEGKAIQNIVNNLKVYAQHITLVDVIRSFNFKLVGQKAAEVCAKLMSDIPCSIASLPAEAYEWAKDKSSRQYYLVKNAMELLDVSFIEYDNSNLDAIPIIMTGSPDVCSEYKTKGAFLKAHPEYIETTSWKECKILFCDDLESNSGKMQKAKKLGIEIKLYSQVVNTVEKDNGLF